jgi:putative heme-binding domain-containing protein
MRFSQLGRPLADRLSILVLLIWAGGVSDRLAPAQEPKLVAETEPLTPQEQLSKFHLPPGFRIELIAAEPDVRKPMNLKFDAAGRLYFTQSVEYPWPVADGHTGRDSIRRLVDRNGDGVPDTTEVFAEGLNIPIGVTPVDGGLLGFSIPTLYYFPDRNGDGLADQRIEYYRQFGFRDTHGMCSSLNWWIDGWVYGCHGFSNESTVAGADGRPIVMQSGNTYRLRPDGSHIEYYTHGQVNPFGLCLDPLGQVYTADCHSKPAYALLRGAYYPSFGKPHDGLGFGPELMQHLHGSTGICGIVYYAARHFPAEFHDNLLIGNPVTGRINRDRFEYHGSTPRAIELPDFLTCDDPWFRPVDLQLAPDGSLYIADFYNRIIGHYEVPLTHPGRDRERGRIWRVTYVGTDGQTQPPPIPNLEQASITQLIETLGHPHLSLRVPATHQLVSRATAGELDTIAAALQSTSPEARAHALWVLARRAALQPEQKQKLIGDRERLVRVHTVKAIVEQPEWTEADRQCVHRALTDADPFVRRAAVEAVSRHPAAGDEARLLSVWDSADSADAMLIHATKIALRDVLRARQSLADVGTTSLSTASRARLVEVCLGLPAESTAVWLLHSWQAEPWPNSLLEPVAQLVSQFVPTSAEPEWNGLLAQWQEHSSVDVQIRLLRAVARGQQARGNPLSEVAVAWGDRLAAALLKSDDAGSSQQALELIRDLRLIQSATALPAWLTTSAPHPGLKPLVIDTLAAIGHPELLPAVNDLLAQPDITVDLQQHAAQVLAGLNQEPARVVLLERLKTAPSPVAMAIARGLALGTAGGQALLNAIEKGQASPRLLQDPTVEQRLSAARIPQLAERRAALLDNLPPVPEAAAELQQARQKAFLQAQPDLARGGKLFQQHCNACHQLQTQGGKVGPALDGVGLRGLARLLEDTLDPNRNVDAAFRATVVSLTNGQVLSGLALREEGAVLILADDQGKERRIPLGEIEERRLVTLSPMPANIAEKISEADFSDLLAFLLSQRTGPADRP